jgi:hypothetical protein
MYVNGFPLSFNVSEISSIKRAQKMPMSTFESFYYSVFCKMFIFRFIDWTFEKVVILFRKRLKSEI